MSTASALVLLVVLLAGNALFVAAEFSLVTVRRDQLEPLAAAGSWRARITVRVLKEVNTIIAGTQLGITACSLGIGAVGEPAVARLLEVPFALVGLPEALIHPVALVIALVIVVYLHMMLGEMVPKNIALAGPVRGALLLGPMMYVFCAVVRPFLWLMNATANVFLRLMRVQPRDEVEAAFDRDQVRAFVEDSGREGLLDEDELRLLASALDFETLTAADVALSAESLTTVPSTVTVAELEEVAARTGFSRFPVVGPHGDLTGYVHVKDVLGVSVGQRDVPVIPRFLNPLPSVPADARLREVVTRMQRSHAHLARLGAPHGDGSPAMAGTAADAQVAGGRLVALEDVLEELVGEVRDVTSAGA